MSKSTIRFVSLLLTLLMICSFPITVQAQTSYDETFTGTYTAPMNVKNVLVSGATVSQWYGDRAIMNGKTYSVRQNQYGLNKDGNMIKMQTNQKYTVWLAQYGVASFSFTAPSSGKYVLSATDNNNYKNLAPHGKSLNIRDTDMVTRVDSLYLYDTPEGNTSYVCELTSGQNILIAANANNEYDYVYDVSVTPYSTANCCHYWVEAGETENGCNITYKYKCSLCNKTKTESYERHNPDVSTGVYTGVNCSDEEYYHQLRCKCCDCGKEVTEYVSCFDSEYSNVNVITSGNTVTKVCNVCGNSYSYTNEGTDHTHQWEERSTPINNTSCMHIEEYCTICGKVLDDWNRHNTNYVCTPIGTGECEYVEYSCPCGEKCGSYYNHCWQWEYVQVTPQHDNVCGTYNYKCACCSLMKYDENLTCHSYDTTWNGCIQTKTCKRCGDVQKIACHDYNKKEVVAPTCTTQGYTLYVCKDCGATEKNEYVSATGHNFANNSPTCSNCGAVNPNYVSQAPTSVPAPSPTLAQTTTPAKQSKPKTPSKVKLSKGKKKITVSFKKVSGVSGYQIKYSTSKKYTKKTTKTVALKGAKNTSKTINKLKGNKKYYVRVRSYKTVKGKKVYSSWSKTQSVTTKK